MRTLLLALILLLCAAAPAAAAEISLKIGPSSGVVMGESHEVTGVLTDDDGDPLPDQVVTMSVRAWPYKGDYRDIDIALLVDNVLQSNSAFQFASNTAIDPVWS